MDHIQDIERIAGQYAAIEDELRHAVARAKRGGFQVAEIARAARVTRQTVYRWIAQQDDDPENSSAGRMEVRRSLDDALILMPSMMSGPNARTVAQRAKMDDVSVKVLGMQIATASFRGRYSELSDEDQSIITTGQRVASAAQQIFDRTRRWPNTVKLTN